MKPPNPLQMFARIAEVSVDRYRGSGRKREKDLLAIEEPLEIQLGYEEEGKQRWNMISLTMRTPGDDRSLVLGFLFAEGIITSIQDVASVEEQPGGGRDKPFPATLSIALKPHVTFDPTLLERHFFSTSSCGVCGRLTLDHLPARSVQDALTVTADVIYQLPDKINSTQTLFRHTGGIHAAALFDHTGRLIHLSEDVGRHNAMDKLVGYALENGPTPPLTDHILLFSGRVSYELVQKAVAAGIPIVAAIGAPSSLAVEIASSYGVTLIGFLRDNRFNIYSGASRIRPPD